MRFKPNVCRLFYRKFLGKHSKSRTLENTQKKTNNTKRLGRYTFNNYNHHYYLAIQTVYYTKGSSWKSRKLLIQQINSIKPCTAENRRKVKVNYEISCTT